MATKSMSEIFLALASQAGEDTESQDMKNILSDKRLTEVQIPDDLANKLTTGLLTINAAKQHPEVNSHFKVKHLKGVDNRLSQEFKAIGLPEEVLLEMNGIADTLGKINFIAPKIQEHYQTTLGGKKGDEKYIELTGKYNTLVKEKQTLAEQLDSEKTRFSKEREDMSINYEVNRNLTGYQFGEAYQTEDVQLLVSKKLSEKPLVFRKTDSGIGVFQKDNPDLKAMSKDNKELTIKMVLDEVVAPYLKKNGGGGNGSGKRDDTPPPPQTGNKKFPGASKLRADIERVRELREGRKTT